LDVSKKLSDLGCRVPQHIALLPVNFDSATNVSEFVQASEASTIRKLLLAQNVPVDDILDRHRRPAYLKNKYHEWVAPIIFVSASLYSQNPEMVSLALNIVGNYATEFFRGLRGEHKVTFDVVVGTDGTYKRITYKGPVEGLQQLPKILREVIK
jgi:hypothetical protein